MSNLEKQNKMTFSVAITTDYYKSMIKRSITDPKKESQFIASITSAVAVNPALYDCDPATILSGALLGNSLGLTPSPHLGQYYLVPFWNSKKGCNDAQFIIGYKGLIQLALRSGQYKRLNVMSIKRGELLKFDPLTEEIELNLIEDDALREATETAGYVAIFEYLNGFRKTIYWSREKMQSHAIRYSKGYAAKKGYTFWEKDFDQMAYKTMLRQLISKWGIMSVDMQTVFDEESKYEADLEPNVDFFATSQSLPEEPQEPEQDPVQEPKSEPKQVSLDEM